MTSDPRSYPELTGKPRPIEGAPVHGRKLLGALLAQRRAELGYTHRPAFTRDRLPLTPSGNPNTRLAADIEEAYRDTFPEPRLRQLAQAYRVTYESLVAVAHMRVGDLVPSSPGDRAPAIPPGWPSDHPPADESTPPMPPERAASDRPWYKEINEQRVALAAQGITAPSGAQMFPDAPDDAKLWDGIGARLDLDDRAWFIADLRRRAHGRDGNSGSSAAGLGRSYVAA